MVESTTVVLIYDKMMISGNILKMFFWNPPHSE